METSNTDRDNPPGAHTQPAGADSKHESSYDVLIAGGGAAGIALASRLAERDIAASVAIIEPSEHHYDQQNWMRVATEGLPKTETQHAKADLMPPEIDWIADSATSVNPDEWSITTASGQEIHYRFLVVALGVEPRWDQLRGVKESLGTNGVCSIFDYEQAEKAWEMIRSFQGGTAIFTAPAGPFKGASAPLDVLHRAAEYWAKEQVRDRTTLIFATTGFRPFGGDGLDEKVEQDVAGNQVQIWQDHELIEVRGDIREAVFRVEDGASTSERVARYDLLHVVPPMRAPEVIAASPLACRDGNMKGFLQVDPDTLRHQFYTNVFAAGDIAGIATIKTAEHAREQAGIIAEQIQREIG